MSCPFVNEYMSARKKQTTENMSDTRLHESVNAFTREAVRTNYTKAFSWMGRPIIQYPTDLMALQEIIFKMKPDIIVETGTAFGGTALFYASIFEMMGRGNVITIDIDIREHNRQAIEDSDLSCRIDMIESDSTDPDMTFSLREALKGKQVMVCLDSNHAESHVLKELKMYAPMVTKGQYLVVFDTAIEFFMTKRDPHRPWGPGDNPYTAVKKFLSKNNRFVVDAEIENRILLTAAPGGWLRRVK